jgi:CDP-diacylglycerol--glycerol-3-phosphate 3-phosphatidyltransferase
MTRPLSKQDIPNLLSGFRILAAVGVFLILLFCAGALPGQAEAPPASVSYPLLIAALALWVVGAATDWFDGYLARRWNAVSVWGKILDPIADKIAVLFGIVGLLALEPTGRLALPGGLILLRELWVSGLREVGASRGVSFPVTLLAKWKTTLQLIGLGLAILAAATTVGVCSFAQPLTVAAGAVIWLAALVTLWTGWEYTEAAIRQLKD